MVPTIGKRRVVEPKKINRVKMFWTVVEAGMEGG